MFKKIFARVNAFFKGIFSFENSVYGTTLRREVLLFQYDEILRDLKKSTTLLELVSLKKRIQEFKQTTIEHHDEIWARQYVTVLVRVWNAKYRSWKGR